MKPMDIITKLGCERATNRAILNEGGRRAVIARVVDGEWRLTEEGEKRGKALEDAAPKKRTPKPGATPPEAE